MPWWPRRSFALQSPLSAERVAETLARSVQRRRWLGVERDGRPFEGEVTGSTFEINRVVTSHKSTKAILRGTVSANATGSRIAGELRLSRFWLASTLTWLGILGGGSIYALREALAGRDTLANALIPAALVVAAWVANLVSFASEAKSSELLLAKIIRGSRVESEPSRKPRGFY